MSIAGTQQLKTRFSLVFKPDNLDWTWTLIGLDEGSSAQWPVGRSFFDVAISHGWAGDGDR